MDFKACYCKLLFQLFRPIFEFYTKTIITSNEIICILQPTPASVEEGRSDDVFTQEVAKPKHDNQDIVDMITQNVMAHSAFDAKKEREKLLVSAVASKFSAPVSFFFQHVSFCRRFLFFVCIWRAMKELKTMM